MASSRVVMSGNGRNVVLSAAVQYGGFALLDGCVITGKRAKRGIQVKTGGRSKANPKGVACVWGYGIEYRTRLPRTIIWRLRFEGGQTGGRGGIQVKTGGGGGETYVWRACGGIT